MPAFYVEPGPVDGETIVVEGEEAHHMCVRRQRRGDEIDLIDGVGCGYRVRIETLEERRMTGQILRRTRELGESPVRLHLVAAVVKGARFDVVIEKATEVGVASITPAIGARGVVRPGADSKRGTRWQRLARSAAKQCGRSRVPVVGPPTAILEAARRLADDGCRLLVADVHGDVDLKTALATGHGDLALFIGPEGGFEDAERHDLLTLGAHAFAWGQRTLRAETAAVVLSALVLDAAERQVSLPQEETWPTTSSS